MMRRMVRRLFLLACLPFALFVGFFWGKGKEISLFSKAEKKAFDGGFRPSIFRETSPSFVVLVVGKNDGAYLEAALRSVFSQRYGTFRVVYVDQGSEDGSFALAEDRMREWAGAVPVGFLQKGDRAHPWETLVEAIGECDEREIVLVVSAQDRLAHPWVLEMAAQFFANPDLWMALGKSLSYPSFAEDPFVYGDNLREGSPSFLPFFYAKLFREIAKDKEPFLLGDRGWLVALSDRAKGHMEAIQGPMLLRTSAREEISVPVQEALLALPEKPPLLSLFLEETSL